MSAKAPIDPDGMVPAGTAKSVDAQESRAFLIARKQLLAAD